jgi:hypothetical protein
MFVWETHPTINSKIQVTAGSLFENQPWLLTCKWFESHSASLKQAKIATSVRKNSAAPPFI